MVRFEIIAAYGVRLLPNVPKLLPDRLKIKATNRMKAALWLTYLAKRKSERAPGVGKETNFFSISKQTKRVSYLNNFIDLKELERIYDAFEAGQNTAFQTAKAAFKTHLENKLPRQDFPAT